MMCSMLKASGQKKSLVVVAVSSPYDFAMDKTVGTYVCTFDFTETAKHALVRGLFGEFTPHGTLLGSLRKSKKALKSRQQWLVESYSRDRDAQGLDDLLQSLARASAPHLPFLGATTAAAFELFNPSMDEAHFVVRNSSTKALYGFCATYYYTKGGTGSVGALLVDPAKRNVAVGRSLHRRALRNLVQKRGSRRCGWACRSRACSWASRPTTPPASRAVSPTTTKTRQTHATTPTWSSTTWRPGPLPRAWPGTSATPTSASTSSTAWTTPRACSATWPRTPAAPRCSSCTASPCRRATRRAASSGPRARSTACWAPSSSAAPAACWPPSCPPCCPPTTATSSSAASWPPSCPPPPRPPRCCRGSPSWASARTRPTSRPAPCSAGSRRTPASRSWPWASRCCRLSRRSPTLLRM